MKNKETNKATVVIVLLIIVVVAIFWMRKQNSKNETSSILAAQSETNAGTSIPYTPPAPKPPASNSEVNDNTILSIGMRGTQVRKLQKLINVGLRLLMQPTISEDGHFGVKTERALFSATGQKRISYYTAYNKLKSNLAARAITLDNYL